MNNILDKIHYCKNCPLSKLKTNIFDIDKGYGKLLPFWTNLHHGKIMLVGLNPSYRRFPGIHQAFGGQVKHAGTGYVFMKLLEDLDLLDSVYITNLVKCSTTNNKIDVEIIKKCFPILRQEIEAVAPKKIIALGRKAYDYLKPRDSENIVTYAPHPCYWSAYNKMSKQEYSRILWNLVNL